MYLRSLEMVGFKSFAERTKLVFEPGMMAIVGPNGCGKSNVSDAIRWVLGEQSAKALRGGAMTDVIFNGTDGTKAHNMAEVSLTLADCEAALGTEWNEVTVTRRVFRSGEGQYLMNKTPCRLRDIQRLFMDTGLGTNSYSVMEQGRIDQILSSRAEDRREVFEEASGISKYKADKKEALRKLEHTEANLARLGDILREVKRQMISLQRQAGKARRYQELRERLRGCELWLGRGKLEESESAISRLEAEHGELAAEEEKSAAAAAASEEGANRLRGELGEVEKRIAAAMDAAGEARGALERTRESIRVNRERAEEMRALSQRDSRETEAAGATLEGHRKEKAALEEELAGAVEAQSAAQKAWEEKQGALAAHDRKTEESRRALQKWRTEAAELENALGRAQGEWAQLEARERADLLRKERLSAEKAEAERAAGAYREQLAGMESKRGELAAAVEEGTKKLGDLRAGQAERRGAMAALQQSLAGLGKDLAAREAQIQLLTKSRAEARGYPEGARKLLENELVPGVKVGTVTGALAEQVRADRKSKKALEAVLRFWLDAVLVKDGATAVETIRRLSEARGGAVRLLPLDGEPGDGDEGAGLPGELLLGHVKVKAGAEGLARRLLGRVRLVEADELPADPGGWTWVTPEGLVVRAEGAAEVWAPKGDESNPMAREHQLAEWQEERERLAEERAGKEKELKGMQEAEAASRESVAAATAELEGARRELAMAEGEKRMAEKALRQAEEQSGRLDAEWAALEKKTSAGTARREELGKKMEEMRARQGEVRASGAKEGEALRQLEEARGKLLEEATECRVALSGERQRVEGLRARQGPLEARIRELETLIKERSAGMDSYRERIAALEEASAAAEGKIGELQASEEGAAAALAAEREGRAARQAALAESESALHAARGELDKTRERRNAAEMELARKKMHRQNLLERLAADYQAGEEDVRAAKEPEWEDGEAPEGREALENLTGDLRGKLQAMGPVNLVAIDEYRDLEERHAFLSGQNDDLEKAKKQLTDFISSINQTTTELFTTTFQKVNENFKELFRQLFGGGTAELVLVDNENVLESGIDIVARPPGKKPQSVSLLSGGERTLTALSLLFALFRVKPSAFCLTDELDAALDDNNISRYLAMLDGFLKDTQFLVITHNRQTIGKAKALYGVTMEKRGISTLVSMKFRGDKTGEGAEGSTGAPAAGAEGD